MGAGTGLHRRTGATWAPVASPATGRFVSDVYTSPSVYLAASDNGISRSANGTSWALSNTGLQSLDVKQLAGAGGRIYVTTNDGVHVSTDDGRTWTRMYNNFGDVLVLGTTIIAGANDRLSYSTDGAQTFSDVPAFTGHAPLTVVADPRGGLLVGTSGYGLHRIELP